MLAPAYEVGGDSFDYAVTATTARFAVFDAMGHRLPAGLLATVAIGAYRNARRHGRDLRETATRVEAAVAGQFGGEHFVTGLLAELDLATGALAWHNAGPRAVAPARRPGREDHASRARPAAWLDDPTRTVAAEGLEPGDRLLLFTDGVTEARAPDGEFFGSRRLADLVVREDAAGQPAPETMRRG